MDSNDFPLEGNHTTPLPLGFGMGLAMNEAALQGYAQLTETEKEHIIMRCKDAHSKAEMQKIIESLVPGETVESLLEDDKDRLL